MKINWRLEDGEKYYPEESEIVENLKPNVYGIDISASGWFFKAMPQKTDELLPLKDSISTEIFEEIKKFWSKRDAYKEHKLLWKRGILLYGPPGSGKSSAISLVKADFVAHGGVVLYGHRDLEITIDAAVEFRKREPDTPMLLVIEDIQWILTSEYFSSKLLAFMDGEHQIENIVFIATTNDINSIPENIKRRPGRIDVIKYVGPPSAAAREQYLTQKYPQLKLDRQFDNIVEETEGFYLSHLRELVLDVFLMDSNYITTLSRLKELIITDEGEYTEKTPKKYPRPTAVPSGVVSSSYDNTEKAQEEVPTTARAKLRHK
jgi:hypothetical protein